MRTKPGLKAAVWGAGFIAGSHVEALLAAGVEPAAVVDADAVRAEQMAKRYGIERWGTDPAILYADDIKAVHVCTPPNLHFDMVMELFERGKAVLCEKPLCLTGEQSAKLAAEAARRGLPNAVGFNLRYHAALQRMKAMASGADGTGIGPLHLIHGEYLQEFHALPSPNGWRYDEKQAGRMRAVTEIGTHWFDIAQQVSGMTIVEVSALFANHTPLRYTDEKTGMMYAEPGPGRRPFTVNSEDSALVHLRFSGDNGESAPASVVLCETVCGRANYLSLEVTGRDGSLWWNSEDIGRLHGARKDTGVNTQVFAFGNNGFNDSLRLLVAAFYASLEGEAALAQTGLPAPPSFAGAARIAAICDAVYDSAQADGARTRIKEYK